MSRTSTELPRLEPESSASASSAMAAEVCDYKRNYNLAPERLLAPFATTF